jgi:thiol:disulfide interchange protein DsbD
MPSLSGAAGQSTTVELTLVSDAPRLFGSPFWLGARLRPPDAAHLYWKNPGETGLATTAEFAAPDGYELSQVGYPGPESFTSDRGAVGYGYLGETVLLVRVTPRRADAEATFWVRASWLSCDALCVQESGQASLTLRRDASVESMPLDAFAARLPISGAAFTAEWTDETQVLLSGPEGARLLEWFPLGPIGVDERAPLSTPRDDRRLNVALGGHRPPRRLEGVVRAETPEGVRYYEVDLATPSPVTRATEDPGAPAPK